jgi:hypothetical protein
MLATATRLVDGDVDVKIYRQNNGFGLGGLAYTLSFSESLTFPRTYGTYGWTANDGTFDMSNPSDGSLASATSVKFDTVCNTPGTEFASGTLGIVELIHFTPAVGPNRWIYFDVSGVSASTGLGEDLISGLGGSITIQPDGTLPEVHTAGIFVPEPMSFVLIGVGGLILRIRRTRHS